MTMLGCGRLATSDVIRLALLRLSFLAPEAGSPWRKASGVAQRYSAGHIAGPALSFE
jgi:hypothetical protein